MKRYAGIGIGIFILCALLFVALPKNNGIAKRIKHNINMITDSDKKDKKEDNRKSEKMIVDLSQPLSMIDGDYDGTEDSAWLQAIKKVADTIVDHEFVYSTKKIPKELDKAIDGNKHADCAHLITWAMKDYGVLDTDAHFFAKKKGVLSCKEGSSTWQQLTEHAEIIDLGDGIPGKDTEKLKETLHIGDICCYNNHMNVVAGVKGDKVQYYDAGLTPTEGKKANTKFTDQLRKPYARNGPGFRKNRMYKIIRLKKI